MSSLRYLLGLLFLVLLRFCGCKAVSSCSIFIFFVRPVLEGEAAIAASSLDKSSSLFESSECLRSIVVVLHSVSVIGLPFVSVSPVVRLSGGSVNSIDVIIAHVCFSVVVGLGAATLPSEVCCVSIGWKSKVGLSAVCHHP